MGVFDNEEFQDVVPIFEALSMSGLGLQAMFLILVYLLYRRLSRYLIRQTPLSPD